MKIQHELEIPLGPVACPRPRVSRFVTYYPKKYKDFRKAAKAYLKASDDSVYLYSSEPIHISYVFIFPRPKYMKAKKYPRERIIHTKRPDLDNLIKAMNDVIQDSKIIDDDSQIYSCSAHKYYASDFEHEAIYITIRKG